MMKKFRKKPIVIEAIQWDGAISTVSEIAAVAGDRKVIMGSDHYTIRIETLEGTMEAIRGDWIIRGIEGELYPCKKEIFEKTYEAV